MKKTFSQFFRLLTGTSYGKSVDTTAKDTLMLVKWPNWKVIRLKRGKIELRKVAKICRRLNDGGGGKFVPKFRDFEELHLL